jgi:hypothetical protein
MPNFICVTCGTQFPESAAAPARCPICEDERQYVGTGGQQWTTLEELRRQHANQIKPEEPGLVSLRTEPAFAIGQRAFLVQTPRGNLLWDCVSLLDDATVRAVRELGGLSAIAVSHPHYYASMVEWSREFADAPIYLHRADEPWVQRPDRAVRFWAGDTQPLLEGLTLIHTGGHFDGFQVLHWAGASDGRGVLLPGDQPQVCRDRRWVSFMYSYPNYIPLPPAAVRRAVGALQPFAFDRIYGPFPHSLISADAKAVVQRSMERYLQFVAG